MYFKKLLIITMGFFVPIVLYSQVYYRIEADYTIKEKGPDFENLMMGRVYFDKNQQQIVFDVQFPEKEILIVNDTASIKAITGNYQKHSLSNNLIDFSVFNLFLNGDLDYYGLNKTPFKLEKVEKENGLIISTWVLADKYVNSQVSKMLLSQKDNNLQGLITYGPKDVIISKQIFSNYIQINGMNFPGQVLQITYLPNGEETKKITTYKNVVLNNVKNDSFYKYKYLSH